ncbi:hypothetical protein [Thermoplasma volcanium]|uniref:hypothetical protein n=1 Tax=Thermoplasma volcanium TaxID=50339 RepID=UPI00068F9BB7|nr:hypothetical protein [Thermoplasma volcanium]
MAVIYVYLSGMDQDDAILKAYGIVVKEDKIIVEKSNIILDMTKKIMEKSQDAFKSQLIENILEEILKRS